MKTVFIDSSYLVALASPGDQWHESAQEIGKYLQPLRMIVVEEVLTEFLNFFSEKGSLLRSKACLATRNLLANSNVAVISQSHESFMRGLELYENRADKGFSLTDCITMMNMKLKKIDEILTTDRHFEQEGFKILLKRSI